MPEELTAESTHEDIQEFVDEAIQKVEEDRAGEEPTDAATIAADSDKPVGDMTAETDSGSETASDGEETGDKDWMDDSLKAEVAAYGIDEEELADFSNREELERALRFLDKSALEAGRKAMSEGEQEKPDEEPEPKDESPKDGRYEVSLDTDVYDDELVAEFNRMRDHYESRMIALESRFAEADAQAEEQQFDSVIDQLGHSDLFGKSGKESKKELQRRQDLFVAVKAQQIGLQSFGRDAVLDQSLVGRVARMVFADELGKKDLKNRTRKLQKQSIGRMGGGVTRPTDAPETLRDEARRLYKELESGGS